MTCNYPNCDGGNATGYCHSDCNKVVDIAAERRKREDQPELKYRYTDEAGVEWFTFLVEWGVDGRTFSAELWARNAADAERRLEALKATGRIEGQLFEAIDL